MRTNRMRAGMACLLASLLPLPFAAVQAQGLALPPGARLQLDGGRIEAAGGDLFVGGALTLGAGELRGIGALRIAAGGSADFGSGLATVTGDWENRGAFTAGSSKVELRDGPAASAILGASQFANLSLVSAAGKRYRFESGLTQIVGGNLQIQGQGPAIQVDVSVPGSAAFLNLLPGGSQTIANVGVSDVHATGQRLAPTQTNQGGRGNDSGWFGGGGVAVTPVPVPALSRGLQLLLAAGLILIATRRRAFAAISRG